MREEGSEREEEEGKKREEEEIDEGKKGGRWHLRKRCLTSRHSFSLVWSICCPHSDRWQDVTWWTGPCMKDQCPYCWLIYRWFNLHTRINVKINKMRWTRSVACGHCRGHFLDSCGFDVARNWVVVDGRFWLLDLLVFLSSRSLRRRPLSLASSSWYNW